MRKDFLIAGGVAALIIPDIGILKVLLLLLFLSAIYLIREERGFYLLCAGLPLAVVTGMESPLCALLMLLLLVALLLLEENLLSDRREIMGFIAFCCAAALCAGAFGIFRHAALPLILLGGLAAFAAILILQMEYILKRSYEHEEQKI